MNNYTNDTYRGNDSRRIKNCISKLIEICDFVLEQNLRYNYRNETNNRNNRKAVYGDNNNNNFRNKIKTPSFNSIKPSNFYKIALGNTKGLSLNPNNFSNSNNT